MAGSERPDRNGTSGPGGAGQENRDHDLDRRSRELEAALAARRPARDEGEEETGTGSMAGYGQALKLSSEFIAGIAVGAGLGWLIDRVAGTSPWGLVIFLLLGFAAGVLNVLRSVGVVAEARSTTARSGAEGPEKK